MTAPQGSTCKGHHEDCLVEGLEGLAQNALDVMQHPFIKAHAGPRLAGSIIARGYESDASTLSTR